MCSTSSIPFHRTTRQCVLVVGVMLLPMLGCRDGGHPASVVSSTENTARLLAESSAVGDRSLPRPQAWVDCELFDGVVTPATFNPANGNFDELYTGGDGFEQGVPLISEAEPGDVDYNGGRWHVNVLKPGVAPAKYGSACTVADLDLNDFDSTAEYFECPLRPRRGKGPPTRPLRVPSDFATIQTALDAAIDGDEVVVEPGIYFEAVVVPPLSVVLRSESGDPHDTILDGSKLEEGVSLVLFDRSLDGARAIRGFTIQNAEQALTVSFDAESEHVIENCRFVKNGPETALLALGTSVDILNNVFLDNEGYLYGGAVRVQGVGRIIGNLFRNNDAIPRGTDDLTQGGAICLLSVGNRGGSMEIRDNTFVGNHCTDYGGAIHVVFFFNAQIVGNRFLGNVADVCAGGVYVFNNQGFDVNIEKNLFVGNDSPRGAAIGVDLCEGAEVRSNTIVNSKGGEGIRIESSRDVVVEENIVAFGQTRGIRWFSSTGTTRCNDAYGNPLGDYMGQPASSTDLSIDPLFCDKASQDFRLAADSPCLPENNDCSILIGALLQGCETPAVPAARARLDHLGGGRFGFDR